MIIYPYNKDFPLVCKRDKEYPFQIHRDHLFAYITQFPYLANLRVNTAGQSKRRSE